MEDVDRWLKSLRLHKYTYLFRKLTYEEMLNISEKFLIDLDITKGARNKILVSVKKLNLRHDCLVNMMDDLNQGNISMKDALTVMKDMLTTPIPKPLDEGCQSPTISLPGSGSERSSSSRAASLSRCSTTGRSYTSDSTDALSLASTGESTPDSMPTTTISSSLGSSPYTTSLLLEASANYKAISTNSYFTNPYELTHLFVDTFGKIAQRFIDSGGLKDNACQGIMAAIVDGCLKHNSFTKEQKARVARYGRPIQYHNSQQHYHNYHYYHHNSSQQLQQHHNHHHHPLQQQQQQQQQQHQLLQQQQHYYHHLHSGSHHRRYHAPTARAAPVYKEYSLLGPGKSFELPCLRARAQADRRNLPQLASGML